MGRKRKREKEKDGSSGAGAEVLGADAIARKAQQKTKKNKKKKKSKKESKKGSGGGAKKSGSDSVMGWTALALPLVAKAVSARDAEPVAELRRYVFYRKHAGASSSAATRGSQNSTLFVVNVSETAPSSLLEGIFGVFGTVAGVEFGRLEKQEREGQSGGFSSRYPRAWLLGCSLSLSSSSLAHELTLGWP